MLQQTPSAVASRPDRSRNPAKRQMWRNRVSWCLVYAAVLLTGLAIGAVAYQRSYQPYFGLAWACFALLLAAWIWFPRAALGATIAFTLTGDLVTVWWFPFAKNLSSWESIMYLSDGISLSPLEITIVWGLAVTAYRNLAALGRPFRSAPLLTPLLVFIGFAFVGLVRGLSRGGDARAATLEIRPLILLPLAYLLIVNVCQTRSDYRRMFWAALAAILVQSVLSLQYLLGAARGGSQQPRESERTRLRHRNEPALHDPHRLARLQSSAELGPNQFVDCLRSRDVDLPRGTATRRRRGVLRRVRALRRDPLLAAATNLLEGRSSGDNHRRRLPRSILAVGLVCCVPGAGGQDRDRPGRSRSGGSEVRHLPRTREAQPVLHDSGFPVARNRLRPPLLPAVPIARHQSSSSWRPTFHTTRCSGSGSRWVSAASLHCCTPSVAR